MNIHQISPAHIPIARPLPPPPAHPCAHPCAPHPPRPVEPSHQPNPDLPPFALWTALERENLQRPTTPRPPEPSDPAAPATPCAHAEQSETRPLYAMPRLADIPEAPIHKDPPRAKPVARVYHETFTPIGTRIDILA
ncbi:MAG: hypothetical protein ACTS3F_04900 [Phycisphaerales bacterium]